VVLRFSAAASEKDAIAPGQFRDFGLSVGVPEGNAGDALTFKALQTYAGGEVVRWIGLAGLAGLVVARRAPRKPVAQ
jgi:hypothetical protein